MGGSGYFGGYEILLGGISDGEVWKVMTRKRREEYVRHSSASWMDFVLPSGVNCSAIGGGM